MSSEKRKLIDSKIIPFYKDVFELVSKIRSDQELSNTENEKWNRIIKFINFYNSMFETNKKSENDNLNKSNSETKDDDSDLDEHEYYESDTEEEKKEKNDKYLSITKKSIKSLEKSRKEHWCNIYINYNETDSEINDIEDDLVSTESEKPEEDDNNFYCDFNMMNASDDGMDVSHDTNEAEDIDKFDKERSKLTIGPHTLHDYFSL